MPQHDLTLYLVVAESEMTTCACLNGGSTDTCSLLCDIFISLSLQRPFCIKSKSCAIHNFVSSMFNWKMVMLSGERVLS